MAFECDKIKRVRCETSWEIKKNVDIALVLSCGGDFHYVNDVP